MLTKIDATIKYGKQYNGFGVEILYPGLIRPQSNDSGVFTIGRIDHVRVMPGTLMPMHLHRNDEILTYLRNGKVKHLDQDGNAGMISVEQPMILNAGAGFYHEEMVLQEGGVLEGLQIFIRPQSIDLNPQVHFHHLQDTYSLKWRKIAGNSGDYPLKISSNTWILDMRLEKGEAAGLPRAAIGNYAFLFYVLSGKVIADGNKFIATGESILIENDSPVFKGLETSDIILFVTQTTAAYFDGGMHSGNLRQ